MTNDLQIPASAVRLCELLRIRKPIIQAPMAGITTPEMVAATSNTGALGSFPMAGHEFDAGKKGLNFCREMTSAPFNVNFFCHKAKSPTRNQFARWSRKLSVFAREFEVDRLSTLKAALYHPFDETWKNFILDFRPAVISFHFGLPEEHLLSEIRGADIKVMSTATTVAEAQYLEDRGVDIIIAQGLEAGGHRGMFLNDELESQVGIFALVPQIVDAVSVPVIAAGGVGDGRGLAAAWMLGAAGVQIGTALLLTSEAASSAVYRRQLSEMPPAVTAVTNVFSGRPARAIVNRLVREMGPMANDPPEFPYVANTLVSFRSAAESKGMPDFTPMWCGQRPPSHNGEGSASVIDQIFEDACRRIRTMT